MSSLKNSLLRAGSILALQSATAKCVTRATVNTDIIIVGGGAGGAHAAVQLTDAGQDVIVIEKQADLVRNVGIPNSGLCTDFLLPGWICRQL